MELVYYLSACRHYEAGVLSELMSCLIYMCRFDRAGQYVYIYALYVLSVCEQARQPEDKYCGAGVVLNIYMQVL